MMDISFQILYQYQQILDISQIHRRYIRIYLNLAFSDDYSKFEYLYLIHRKCVVLDKFIEFKTY